MCSIWGPDIPIRPILGTSRPTKDQLPPRNILTKAKWIHCKNLLRVKSATETKFLYYVSSKRCQKRNVEIVPSGNRLIWHLGHTGGHLYQQLLEAKAEMRILEGQRFPAFLWRGKYKTWIPISSLQCLFSLNFWIIKFKFIFHIVIFRHTSLNKNWSQSVPICAAFSDHEHFFKTNI